jgi:hypothetical protein
MISLTNVLFAACDYHRTVNRKLFLCCWTVQLVSIHWQFGRPAAKLPIAGLVQKRLL